MSDEAEHVSMSPKQPWLKVWRGDGHPTWGAVWIDLGRLRLIRCAPGHPSIWKIVCGEELHDHGNHETLRGFGKHSQKAYPHTAPRERLTRVRTSVIR